MRRSSAAPCATVNDRHARGSGCRSLAVIIDQYGDVHRAAPHEAHVLEQLKLEGRLLSAHADKRAPANLKVRLGAVKRATDAFNALEAKFREAFEGEEGRKLAEAMQVAQNVGSTLRPTPEMVEIIENVKKFREALETIRDFGEKMKKYADSFGTIDGRSAFKLYDTYGFPIELTMEMAHEKGIEVDEKGFEERFKQHQATSHAGAEQRFKGGLADNTEETAKLHTATHLLHAALRKVLGNEVAQKGSNITAERLRFDFSFGRKMTPEEIAEVERLVNEAIEAKVPVTCEEMTVTRPRRRAPSACSPQVRASVKVYTTGNFSKEICGGPHASNTGDLKSFKIKKEESSSAACAASRPSSTVKNALSRPRARGRTFEFMGGK